MVNESFVDKTGQDNELSKRGKESKKGVAIEKVK